MNPNASPLEVLLQQLLTIVIIITMFAFIASLAYKPVWGWYTKSVKYVVKRVFGLAWSPFAWMWRTQKKLLAGIVVGVIIALYFLNN